MNVGKKARPPISKFEFSQDECTHKMIKEKMDTVRQLLMQKLQAPVNNTHYFSCA